MQEGCGPCWVDEFVSADVARQKPLCARWVTNKCRNTKCSDVNCSGDVSGNQICTPNAWEALTSEWCRGRDEDVPEAVPATFIDAGTLLENTEQQQANWSVYSDRLCRLLSQISFTVLRLMTNQKLLGCCYCCHFRGSHYVCSIITEWLVCRHCQP